MGNNSGQGTFNQQAGTSNTTGNLFIGSQGTYNLAGGSLNVGNTIGGQGTIVGTSGAGLFNQTGGTHAASTVIVGNRNDSSAAYLMQGGDLEINGVPNAPLSGTLFVGLGDDGPRNPTLLNGLFQHTTGSVRADRIVIGGFTEIIPDPTDPINNPPTSISHFGTGRYDLSGTGIVTANSTSVGNTSQGSVRQYRRHVQRRNADHRRLGCVRRAQRRGLRLLQFGHL